MKTIKEVYDWVELYIVGGIIPKDATEKQFEVIRKLQVKLDNMDQENNPDKAWKMMDETAIKVYKMQK